MRLAANSRMPSSRTQPFPGVLVPGILTHGALIRCGAWYPPGHSTIQGQLVSSRTQIIPTAVELFALLCFACARPGAPLSAVATARSPRTAKRGKDRPPSLTPPCAVAIDVDRPDDGNRLDANSVCASFFIEHTAHPFAQSAEVSVNQPRPLPDQASSTIGPIVDHRVFSTAISSFRPNDNMERLDPRTPPSNVFPGPLSGEGGFPMASTQP